MATNKVQLWKRGWHIVKARRILRHISYLLVNILTGRGDRRTLLNMYQSIKLEVVLFVLGINY